MTILPVIARELRRRSRRRLTYWTRAGVALAGVLVAIPPFISSDIFGSADPAETAKQVFNSIAWALFLVCSTACVITADAIGQERRDGTLGLLMLTRVRGLDLLLGKFGSAGMAALGAAVALLPLLMLPVLAGGVAAGEAFRKGLALLSTLNFALAMGLFASALRIERFRAVRLAIAAYVLFTILPWVCWLLLQPVKLLMGFSPLVLMIVAGDDEYRFAPESYWSALGMVNVMAWVLLLIAAVRLRRSWMDKEQGIRVVEVETIRPIPVAKRWRFRTAGLSDPIAWLVSQHRGARLLPWWATLIIGIYLCVSWVMVDGDLDLPSAAFWLMYAVASTGTDALLAVAAGQFFLESRRSGQLETLLTTPVGTTLMTSHWRALRKRLRWPVVCLVAMVVIHTTGVLRAFAQRGVSGADLWWGLQFPVSWMLDATGTLAEVGTACWVGMWLALRGESRPGIAGWAAASGTGVPILIRLGLWLGAEPVLTRNFEGWGWIWPWMFTEWLAALLVIAYYWRVYRFAKSRVAIQLSGAESTAPATLRRAGSLLRTFFGWPENWPRRSLKAKGAPANSYS